MNAERRNELLDMLRAQVETRHICAQFRLTRQRVHQIAKAHDLKLTHSAPDGVGNRKRIEDWLRRNPCGYAKDCAIQIGLSDKQTTYHMTAIRAHYRRNPPEPVPVPPRHDRRARLEAVRLWFLRNPGGKMRTCGFALNMHEHTVSRYVQMLRAERSTG